MGFQSVACARVPSESPPTAFEGSGVPFWVPERPVQQPVFAPRPWAVAPSEAVARERQPARQVVGSPPQPVAAHLRAHYCHWPRRRLLRCLLSTVSSCGYCVLRDSRQAEARSAHRQERRSAWTRTLLVQYCTLSLFNISTVRARGVQHHYCH